MAHVIQLPQLCIDDQLSGGEGMLQEDNISQVSNSFMAHSTLFSNLIVLTLFSNSILLTHFTTGFGRAPAVDFSSLSPRSLSVFIESRTVLQRNGIGKFSIALLSPQLRKSKQRSLKTAGGRSRSGHGWNGLDLVSSKM